LDIDGFHLILDEVAEEIPEDLLQRLNGGILVLPEIKYHPTARARDLFVMGEYHVQIPGLGRYIVLYYGSFEQVFGSHTSNGSSRLRSEIRRTLIHELRHHIESLSGVKDLEREDERAIEAYHLKRFNDGGEV